MKTPDQITPTFGPVYAAAVYPDLCSLFQHHGYALAVHGSLARDFDLIAVPWADTCTPDREMVRLACAMLKAGALPPVVRPAGRIAYTIMFAPGITTGACKLDLSFLTGMTGCRHRYSKDVPDEDGVTAVTITTSSCIYCGEERNNQ